MKTRTKFLSLVLCVSLCFSLSTVALAGSSTSSFNPTVTLDRTNEEHGTFTVTVPEANNAILADKTPILSVACSYSYAKVTGPDGEIAATIADGKISFPVTKGGTYTVTKTDPPIYYDPSYSVPTTSTTTETNPDGSVTTTVTNTVTGTVTETTTYPNGVKTVTETTANGVITAAVSLPSAADNAVVTIPVANATAGTVAVIVHADGTEEIVQTCVVTEDGVALIVEDDVQLKIVDNSMSFADVPTWEWYADAVDFASARGIITGNTSTTFGPGIPTTRAMIWTMLARMEGVDTSVGETWWSIGQQWAMENGVSDGSMPDQVITREQLITMLYRYAQLKGMDVSVGEDTNILSYNDAFEVSEWAIPAMQWACGSGVVQGDGVNLMPSATASRAEVAQILMNFCNYLVL